jgi:hydrogenase/urease accessory protein HupE
MIRCPGSITGSMIASVICVPIAAPSRPPRLPDAPAAHLRLGLYVRLPETCEQLGEPRAMLAGDAYMERWSVRHPEALVGETIFIDGLQTTLTDVLVRIARLDGSTQVARLTPASPSLDVVAAPGAWQVSWTYLVLGVEHILFGVDHLLFVLALLLLVRDWRRLVATITSFTVAHSVTLALATLGVLSVPGPPVEACIALSIVFVAAEVIRSRQGAPGLTERAPWIVALSFGLLHGLGFAGALADVGLPPQAIPAALLFFSVGVEAGQLAFIAAALGALAIVRRIRVRRPAWSWRIMPTAVGAVAVTWVIDRTSGFF